MGISCRTNLSTGGSSCLWVAKARVTGYTRARNEAMEKRLEPRGLGYQKFARVKKGSSFGLYSGLYNSWVFQCLLRGAGCDDRLTNEHISRS